MIDIKKYIFTFGAGQEFEGFYQPIYAKDYFIARKIMFETYGSKWSMQYTEEEWIEIKKNAYHRIEHPLKAIYEEGESK